MLVVLKDWGREEWLVHTELYTLKHLYLNPGWMCSLHRHLIKDETFLLREGVVRIELGDGGLFMLPVGNTVHVPPGVWHRFSAYTPALLVEVSTCHDDADVERREPSRRFSLEGLSDGEGRSHPRAHSAMG